MKQYKKLPIPKDSAWDDTRFKWRRYVHWRIRYFFIGLANIIRWIPTLYHDRDWDDYFVTKVFQKKIEFQRKYLINANRHTEIDRDNRYMTLTLNLIEREHEEFYLLEKYSYQNIYDYIAKYSSKISIVKKMYPDKNLSNEKTLAVYLGMYNQDRCHKLLYRVLERHVQCWWD